MYREADPTPFTYRSLKPLNVCVWNMGWFNGKVSNMETLLWPVC